MWQLFKEKEEELRSSVGAMMTAARSMVLLRPSKGLIAISESFVRLRMQLLGRLRRVTVYRYVITSIGWRALII